jgi:hypothetical protein
LQWLIPILQPFTTMKRILTLSAFFVATATAFAEDAAAADPAKAPGKHDAEAVFKKIDANADGSVSKEEWSASPKGQKKPDKLEKKFSAMDKDSDGKISKEEFIATNAGKAKK